MLVATVVGLVLVLAVLSIYYRYRVATDGLCVDVGRDGQVRRWQFGPYP